MLPTEARVLAHVQEARKLATNARANATNANNAVQWLRGQVRDLASEIGHLKGYTAQLEAVLAKALRRIEALEEKLGE